MKNKSYKVSLTLEQIVSDSPLNAAKSMLYDLIEDGSFLIYDVEDEETGEKFTVDLAEEEDEDAVLPFKTDKP